MWFQDFLAIILLFLPNYLGDRSHWCLSWNLFMSSIDWPFDITVISLHSLMNLGIWRIADTFSLCVPSSSTTCLSEEKEIYHGFFLSSVPLGCPLSPCDSLIIIESTVWSEEIERGRLSKPSLHPRSSLTFCYLIQTEGDTGFILPALDSTWSALSKDTKNTRPSKLFDSSHAWREWSRKLTFSLRSFLHHLLHSLWFSSFCCVIIIFF